MKEQEKVSITFFNWFKEIAYDYLFKLNQFRISQATKTSMLLYGVLGNKLCPTIFQKCTFYNHVSKKKILCWIALKAKIAKGGQLVHGNFNAKFPK